MSDIVKFTRLVLIVVAIMPVLVEAQSKSVKPLSENASLADTQKFLVESVRKHASYKTRTMSVTISDVKFDGCGMGISLVRRSNSIAHDQMGVRTRTHTSKQDFSFDLSFIKSDGGITLADHIYPELQTVTIRFRSGEDVHVTSNENRDIELIVKREAGEAIRSALIHARKLCIAKL